MSYTVTRRDQTVIEPSPLGLVSTSHDLSTGVKMIRTSARLIDESYSMPTGKRRERRVSGSEISSTVADRHWRASRAHPEGP